VIYVLKNQVVVIDIEVIEQRWHIQREITKLIALFVSTFGYYRFEQQNVCKSSSNES